MADEVERRSAKRGAAGGDVRLRDVPSELLDACAHKIDELLETKDATTPIVRELKRALAQQRLALPVVSTTLTRVLGLLEKESVAIADLALAVESDPALATKIVGVANSGFYGGIDSIASVQDALMRTGLEQAKNIVAGVAIRSSVFRAPGFEALMDALWQRSLATALATLALLETDERWRDSAFLLGLVHDVGRIVLLATAAVPLQSSGRAPEPRAIEDTGDVLRCELGAIALASWAFDEELIDAVIWQEQPEACPEESRPLAAGLYAADTLVNLGIRGWQPGRNADLDERVRELMEPLGFDLQQCREILMLVESGMSAFAKVA